MLHTQLRPSGVGSVDSRRGGDRGFTLIELLVVLSIIALLAAIAFAALARTKARARDARRTADIHQIQNALELYYDGHGSSYPATAPSQNLADIAGVGKMASTTDPLTRQSYKYVGTNKNVAGDNIICNSEPCTGYVLMATKEVASVPADTQGVIVKDGGGTVVATSTESNLAGSNIALVPIASIPGASGTSTSTSTPPSGLAATGLAGTWTKISLPGFKDQSWTGVAYGNGVYVAVGGNDTSQPVLTSTNGTTWTPRTIGGINQGYDDVVFGNGKFVAISGSGYSMTSTDGITWTRVSAPLLSSASSAITYGAGLYVVVGGSQATGQNVLTSADGLTWTQRTNPIPADTTNAQNWYDVAFDGTRFVAVAAGGTGTTDVMTSVDGITWTARATPTLGGDGIWGVGCSAARCVGTYFPSGSSDAISIYSTNGGVTWATSTMPTGNWGAVAYASSTFVAAAPGYGLATSPDGITWTSRSGFGGVGYAIAGGGPLFVALKYWALGDGVDAVTSPDAVTWTSRATALPEKWSNLSRISGTYYVNDKYGNIITSTNGNNWSAINTNMASTTSRGWGQIVYGAGVYVTIAANNAGGLNLATSVDGTNWTLRAMPSSKTAQYITYNGGKFVAIDNGYSLTSNDGINWTVNASAALSTYPNSLTWGAGKYVAITSQSFTTYVVTSPDGVTWTRRPAGTIANSDYAVGYDGTRFVATGYYADPYVSTDTVTWTAVPGTDLTNNEEGKAPIGCAPGACVALTHWNDAFAYYNDPTTWVATGLDHYDMTTGIVVENLSAAAYRTSVLTEGYFYYIQ